MKKIFAIVVFIVTVGNTLALSAGEYLGDAAWKQLRLLHGEYLGRPNDMTHGETEMWIAQDMNRWLGKKRADYLTEIRILRDENERLRAGVEGIGGGDVEILREKQQRLEAEKARLEAENASLKEELEFSKMLNSIAYSIIAVILFGAVGFILIKKSQAKKLPQKIKAVIADQTK